MRLRNFHLQAQPHANTTASLSHRSTVYAGMPPMHVPAACRPPVLGVTQASRCVKSVPKKDIWMR